MRLVLVRFGFRERRQRNDLQMQALRARALGRDADGILQTLPTGEGIACA